MQVVGRTTKGCGVVSGALSSVVLLWKRDPGRATAGGSRPKVIEGRDAARGPRAPSSATAACSGSAALSSPSEGAGAGDDVAQRGKRAA